MGTETFSDILKHIIVIALLIVTGMKAGQFDDDSWDFVLILVTFVVAVACHIVWFTVR